MPYPIGCVIYPGFRLNYKKISHHQDNSARGHTRRIYKQDSGLAWLCVKKIQFETPCDLKDFQVTCPSSIRINYLKCDMKCCLTLTCTLMVPPLRDEERG